jgi:hypothetical protein
MVNFNLRLGDTYWSTGFFNVSVDVERYLTTTDGPIDIFLGDEIKPLAGRISRTANRNATPRIFGNKPLADFFQRNFKRGDSVSVEIVSLEAIRIGRVAESPQTNNHQASGQAVPSSASQPGSTVSADQLATWRRTLIGLLNDLEPGVQRAPDEGLAKRIQRLSYARLIPRHVAAMMRVLTEMRNMTEYESKVLSASEGAVAVSAWAAIRHWADTRKS